LHEIALIEEIIRKN